MKVKYLSFLFLLFLCEFASGQVPGMPKILGKSSFPQVFTLSATLVDINSANVSVQIIDNGQTPVTETGIIWGTSIKDYNTATSDGTIVTDLTAPVGTFSKSAGNATIPLSVGLVYYITAYAKNSAGITYGNSITYQHAVITSSATGRTWLMVNLGASAIPTSSTDDAGYGYLYQWGRNTDGHQVIRPTISGTTTTTSGTSAQTGDDPNNGGLYIIAPSTTMGAEYYNWRTYRNSSLWTTLTGNNNPCPTGFRVPTLAEFNAEINSWSNYGISAFNSLKLTLSGQRNVITGGNVTSLGTVGYYWTSTYNGSPPTGNGTYRYVSFTNSSSGGNNAASGNGYAVRCIKN